MNVKFFAPIILIGSLTACVDTVETGTPSVGNSSDLSAFQGAKAGQAEMGIQNLGYELIRSEGLTSYWSNRSTGACAQIVTSDGRYSAIDMLPSGDC